MLNDVIYCLAEIGGDPFYVGRSNNWHRRWKEHILTAKGAENVEMKYQHIRKLWAQGKDFEMIILDENPGLRYEKYYHYLLGGEYNLTNMKMGDNAAAERAAMTAIRKTGAKFVGPVEFLTEFEIAVKKEKARMRAARINRILRQEKACETDDTERTIFVGEDPHKKFISPGLQALRNRHGKIQHSPKRSP